MGKTFNGLLLALGMACASSAYAGYGAIYYSPSTGEYGYSDGYDTYQDAVDGAYSACEYTDCELINWEYNSCNAFATGVNGVWGESHGYSTSEDAVSEAIDACGADCTWRAWICN